MTQTYTDEERKKLHTRLREVLAEVTRVCDEAGIEYFLVGGSLIGYHFWRDIVPFDDDIDVGMTRSNYDRFLKEAPTRLGSKFVLQWFGNTPETPFYFAKVRLKGTRFVEEATRKLNMEQGIYVDIFPFDRIPDDEKKAQRQRKLANIIDVSFFSKTVWTFKYCGRCEIAKPNKHGLLNCLFDRIVVTLVPKRTLYWLLTKVQTHYNRTETTFCSNVMTNFDRLRCKYATPTVKVQFGGITVGVPQEYEEYLNYHYPTLRKYLPKEEVERYSHRPVELSFGED